MPASQPAQSCLGLLAPADLIQHYCHCQLPCLARPWSKTRAPSSEVRHSDTDCCGPSLQATSSSTSCFFTFPHPLLADLGGWSNKAPKQPLPQVCRPSEPLICLHYWSLGCVSSHCLASLPHVGVLLISARKATSVACYSLSCAHEQKHTTMRQRNAALALIGKISRCLFSPRLDDRVLQNRPALPPFAAELGRGAD